MTPQESDLEFPTNPRYYSVLQTSPPIRLAVIGVLTAIAAIATWGLLATYLDRPEDLGSGGVLAYTVTILVVSLLALVIVISRPFRVKNGTIQLVKSVKLKSGRRTRRISFSDILGVSVVPAANDSLEVWLDLRDGTKFRMVTVDDEEGKEFAMRFADYFSPSR